MRRAASRRAVPVLPLAGVALCAFPAAAQAHLVTTGMGPVYDGIGHLLLSPDDLVPAIALALFAGLRGAEAGRRAMFALPPAWFLGGLAGSAVAAAPQLPLPLPAASFLLLGGLVAADVALRSEAVAVLAVLLGLAHGFLNGIVLGGGAGTPGLLGMAAMLFVLVPMASALVVVSRRPAARIAVRVAGSWIAAVGLLMFGWALRGNG